MSFYQLDRGNRENGIRPSFPLADPEAGSNAEAITDLSSRDE